MAELKLDDGKKTRLESLCLRLELLSRERAKLEEAFGRAQSEFQELLNEIAQENGIDDPNKIRLIFQDFMLVRIET